MKEKLTEITTFSIVAGVALALTGNADAMTTTVEGTEFFGGHGQIQGNVHMRGRIVEEGEEPNTRVEVLGELLLNAGHLHVMSTQVGNIIRPFGPWSASGHCHSTDKLHKVVSSVGGQFVSVAVDGENGRRCDGNCRGEADVELDQTCLRLVVPKVPVALARNSLRVRSADLLNVGERCRRTGGR